MLKRCQFRASSVKEQETLFEIQKSQTGKDFALWTVCGNHFSVANGGENDINRHKGTSKHKGYVDAAQRQRKLTVFGATQRLQN